MTVLSIYKPTGMFVSTVPDSWNDLSAKQLIRVAGILFEEDDPYRRDIRIARALCSLPWRLMLRIPADQVTEQLIPLCSWVVEKCDLTRQVLPQIGRCFWGPQDHLRNLRFGEFDAAERALYAWHQEPTFSRLCFFTATIYRPGKTGYDKRKDPDGDLREPYNHNLTAHYAQKLERRISRAQAYAVVLWYKGCRQFITDSFPQVFSAADADKSELPDEPAYFGLIRSIAKEGTYGNYEDVENMYLYNALTELEAVQQDRLRIEEELESNRESQKN